MGTLAKRVFFISSLALLIMCFITAFIAERGSAEFFIVVIAGIINCISVMIQLIAIIIKGKNNGKGN